MTILAMNILPAVNMQKGAQDYVSKSHVFGPNTVYEVGFDWFPLFRFSILATRDVDREICQLSC